MQNEVKGRQSQEDILLAQGWGLVSQWRWPAEFTKDECLPEKI